MTVTIGGAHPGETRGVTVPVYVPSNTKHKPGCTMRFQHKDPTCPRCRELMAGAPVRTWAGDRRKAAEARLSAEIRSHICGPSCGPVCTRFDW